MITWDDSMTTGLPEIDEQHKEIIKKFNEFSEAMSSQQGRDVAGDILDFLQFYAVWHFEREEKCMEQYKCPAAKANKQAHAEFIDKFGQFYEQWQESTMDSDLMRETYLKLAEWIKNHIQRVDTQLYPCVKKAR
jgi:hemerythrin